MGSLTLVPPHTFIFQATNYFVDTKFARQAHFQEKKKTSSTELNTFFSKKLLEIK